MERLDLWCAANEVDEAIIGGFFLRDPYRPLGDLWIDGRPVASEPIVAPYGSRRACVVVTGEDILLASRESVPAGPEGDLLTAGPLLVRDGTVVFDRDHDPEGFTAGAGQFDSDITEGRHPRAALGIASDFLVAVACDGRRSRVDGGLTLPELADVMVGSGRRERDQSGRRGLYDSGPSKAPAQPPLFDAGSACTGVSPDHERPRLRALRPRRPLKRSSPSCTARGSTGVRCAAQRDTVSCRRVRLA